MKRVAIALLLLSIPSAVLAQAPPTKLRTKWAAEVRPDRVLPEYPRPQMVRAGWTNLNGEWEYAVTEKAAARHPNSRRAARARAATASVPGTAAKSRSAASDDPATRAHACKTA